MCYWRCVLVCGLSPALSRNWFTVLWKVSLNLSNKPCTRWPVIRHCLYFPCGSLEVLKTSKKGEIWKCGLVLWWWEASVCTCGWNIWWFLWRYDECGMCCVCEISKFERWVWVTVDLIRLMGFCQSISVDFNKCVCEWVNKARSHSQRLSHLWAREVRWVGARLRLVTQLGPPSSTVLLLHGTL